MAGCRRDTKKREGDVEQKLDPQASGERGLLEGQEGKVE